MVLVDWITPRVKVKAFKVKKTNFEIGVSESHHRERHSEARRKRTMASGKDTSPKALPLRAGELERRTTVRNCSAFANRGWLRRDDLNARTTIGPAVATQPNGRE